MKRILSAAVALAFAAPVLAADGAAVYQAKCKACHGADGTPSAMGAKMGAPDLKSTKADVAATVANGKGKMVGYKGKLTDEEIQAVSEYVKKGLK